MDRPRDVMASRFLVIRYSRLPFATNMWTSCSNFGKWPFSSILKSAAVVPSSDEDLGSSSHLDLESSNGLVSKLRNHCS